MAFGITQNGFSAPQLTDIQSEINAILTSTFGANINLSASSIFGQLSGVFSEREALIWQAMQDVYNSQYPDTAFGASLDNVGAISGISRLGPLPSTIASVALFGSIGTSVPSGTLIAVYQSPTSIFSTDVNTTLIAGQSCIQQISFSAVPTSGTWQLSINGQTTSTLANNAIASVIQTAIQALIFCGGCTVSGNYTSGFTVTFVGAGTGGLQVQPVFTVSNNTLVASGPAVIVTPSITTPGIFQGTVNCTATATGPTIANINTLTVINTPVAGLNSVLNTNTATIGRNAETDNAYRARRASELQNPGAGTFDSIQSGLEGVPTVTAVVLFENTSGVTDGNGLPTNSFEAFVSGGGSTKYWEFNLG